MISVSDIQIQSPSGFTLMISFVFSSCIINEFHKCRHMYIFVKQLIIHEAGKHKINHEREGLCIVHLPGICISDIYIL